MFYVFPHILFININCGTLKHVWASITNCTKTHNGETKPPKLNETKGKHQNKAKPLVIYGAKTVARETATFKPRSYYSLAFLKIRWARRPLFIEIEVKSTCYLKGYLRTKLILRKGDSFPGGFVFKISIVLSQLKRQKNTCYCLRAIFFRNFTVF